MCHLGLPCVCDYPSLFLHPPLSCHLFPDMRFIPEFLSSFLGPFLPLSLVSHSSFTLLESLQLFWWSSLWTENHDLAIFNHKNELNKNASLYRKRLITNQPFVKVLHSEWFCHHNFCIFSGNQSFTLNQITLFCHPFRRETVSELLDHMLHDAQLHPDVALVNGISVLLTLLEVRKGRYDCSCLELHHAYDLPYKPVFKYHGTNCPIF